MDRLAWMLIAGLAVAQAQVNGPNAPSGAAIQIDYPTERHQKNKAGRDGAGLCVFTSISQACDWQDIGVLADMRDWMTKFPGGGYPEKVKEFIARKCREAGKPEPEYVQIEGRELEALRAATKNGWLPCVTYGVSPTGRYGGKKIAHMVNLPHAEGNWFAVLDNNYPGAYEWMSEAQFLKSYTATSNKGWSIIFFGGAPTPPPSN
jgi:hypothetical protein